MAIFNSYVTNYQRVNLSKISSLLLVSGWEEKGTKIRDMDAVVPGFLPSHLSRNHCAAKVTGWVPGQRP
jgi:hypothetical protein